MEIIKFVLNQPKIKEITGWVTYAYPQHEKDVEYLKTVYPECKDVKEFVEKVVRYLKENK